MLAELDEKETEHKIVSIPKKIDLRQTKELSTDIVSEMQESRLGVTHGC